MGFEDMKYFIIFWLALMFSLYALQNPAHAEEMGGAGGSWGNDSGFGGNGGSTGGSGAGGSWGQCTAVTNKGTFTDAQSHCAAWVPNYTSASLIERNGSMGFACYVNGELYAFGSCSAYEPPPECPQGQVLSGGSCVPELECPSGYTKSGSTCIWQCPAGYKMLGGNCVKDDMPEDCDPAIQECDENGEPVCDCCGTLGELLNQGDTQINNDNRIISLTENITSNQNTIINNTENINNNITNVNNNLTNIDNSVQELITTIKENNPEIDTTALENKVDEVINAINNRPTGGTGDGVPTDLQPIIDKISELNESVLNNKYDDSQLQLKIDQLVSKELDFSEVTNRQDEQTSLLEDIKRLLMPTNEAGDPAIDLPEVDSNEVDLWGAIKGFDIDQNIINASAQCPPDKEFTINLGIKTATFAIPMTPMCTYLSYLAPIFLMLAYFSGAMIILKAGD